jgi:hypothetical protein
MRSANVRRSASSRPSRRLVFATTAAAIGAVLTLAGAAAPLPARVAVPLAANATARTTVSPPSANSGANIPAGTFRAVSADSSTDAWAVGSVANPGGNSTSTLTAHWNGKQWTRVPSPSPASGNGSLLSSVAAVSPTDAWAVGFSTGNDFSTTVMFALHWDGTRWTQAALPNVGPPSTRLTSVSAVSASDVWAIGSSQANADLVLHWDGTRWMQVVGPLPPGATAISATSASDAWAVGCLFNGVKSFTDTQHWNGSAWTRLPSPNPGQIQGSCLAAVANISPQDAWAVGRSMLTSGRDQALLVHWDGRQWAQVASPIPTADAQMTAISAVSKADIWAVGFAYKGVNNELLFLHWNGSQWTLKPVVTSPQVTALFGVSARSATDAWAVGTDPTDSLIFHWNGIRWVQS